MANLTTLKTASRGGSLLAALLLSISLTTDSGASASPKMTGWSIDSSSNMMGTVNCKFTDDAVYMRMDKMGLEIITTAPKWNMLVYNDSNKNYMNMTMAQWQQRFGAGLAKKKEPMKTVATNKQEKILGYPAEQFLVKRQIKEKQTVGMELWLTKAINLPNQLKNLFRTFLSLPEDIHGMPLRVLTSQNGKLVPMLEAYKVTKTTFPKDTFHSLSGYKEVKDEMALMMDGSDDTATDSLLGVTSSPSGKPAGAASKLGGAPGQPAAPAQAVMPRQPAMPAANAPGKPPAAQPADTGKSAPPKKGLFGW